MTVQHVSICQRFATAVRVLIGTLLFAAVSVASAEDLMWVTPDSGVSLPVLQAAIRQNGGTVLTLAPEGRLLVRFAKDPTIAMRAVDGVAAVEPVIRTVAPAADALRGLGERPPTPEQEARILETFARVKTVEPNALSRDRATLQEELSLPESADNSLTQYFPPIRSQGVQGSCTAWAAAYYWNTYTQAKDEQLDVSTGDNDHICSPAFIYNLINNGVDMGGYVDEAVARLNDVGTASWSLMPYDDADFSSWPTEAGWIEAFARRTQDAFVIGHWDTGCTDAELTAIKQHLANGGLLVTRTAVYENFYWDYPADGPGISNGVLFANSGANMGGHAMTIVGYDDNKAYHDGTALRTGALLIANSWGSGWGVHNTASTSTGFMWVAYDFFKASNQCFGVAYYNTDRPDYRSRLYAVTGLNHRNRAAVTHRAGVGAPGAPDWLSHAAIQNDGGTSLGIDETRRVAVDLTDGVSFVSDPDVALFSRMSVDGAAPQDGVVSSAVFYHDLDADDQFVAVHSSDPVVTVSPGAGGDATVVFDPEAPPDSLAVSPEASLMPSGNMGGPFDPVAQVYVVTNTGAAALDWTAGCSSNWVSVTPAGGTLPPGGSTNLTVSLTPAAGGLPIGLFTDTVGIENVTSGAVLTRAVLLDVGATLAMAIGQPAWSVVTDGDAGWIAQADVVHTDGAAAQSGGIVDMQSSRMRVEIQGPGQLSFWWKVSSEAHYDFLDFNINDVLQDQIAGEVDWQQKSFPLDVGTHSVEWAYVKDASVSDGADCGWVAEVDWVPAEGLWVLPADAFVASGYAGGPFDPAAQIYTLTNLNETALDWDAAWSGSWLDVSPAGGTLAGGGGVSVTVGLSSAANALAPDVHTDAVVFGSTTTGQSDLRNVTLTVLAIPGEIDVEDSIPAIDDHELPFGLLLVGQERIEQIAVHNTSGSHPLVVDGLDVRWDSSSTSVVSAAAPPPPTVMGEGLESPVIEGVLAPPVVDVSGGEDAETFIVGFQTGGGDQAADRLDVHAAMGAERLHAYRRIAADVVRKPDGQGLEAAMAAYRARPDVAYVEPNVRMHLFDTSDDPYLGDLWGLHNTGQSGGTPGADIDALHAWAVTTGDTNVIVAVIDTGIDYTHPDLAANMWVNPNPTFGDVHGARWTGEDGIPTSGDPMDGHGHGTHCAGTIGAVGDNGIGVAGVNWTVRLMALKFFDDSGGAGFLADAVAALEYALDHGARVSNNSWGGDGYSQTLKDMIDDAGAAGHLFVTAAGNDGRDIDLEPTYPASYTSTNLVSVANSTRTDARASGSNWGVESVDLAAPGTTILSTYKNGGYATMTGTSMATPHVTGVAALLLALHGDATCGDLKDWLLGGVTRLSSWESLVATGGRLNAANALNVADPSFVLTNAPALPASIPPGGTLLLDMRYAPVRSGAQTGRVWIRSNDLDEPEVSVLFSGSAADDIAIGEFVFEAGQYRIEGLGGDVSGFELLFRTNLVSGADWAPVPDAVLVPDGAGGFLIEFDPPNDSPSVFFRVGGD